MRILNIADGYSSNTLPIITPLETGKLVTYISDSAYVSANGTPTGGEIYYNSTTGKARYYNGIVAAWQVIGDQVVYVQEAIGTGNGSNVGFTITNAPINNEALHIFLNGVLQQKTDYSISLPTVTFVTAPSLGTSIYASYLSNGTPASPIVSVGTNNVLYRTITSGEVTAKQLTLPSTPAETTKLLVDMVGGTTLEYGIDFTVSAAIVSWNGLLLDGFIAAGDVLRIQFFN